MRNFLIIDDELTICEILKQTVQKAGYFADHTQSIYDGLSLLDSKEYDVVFLDVVLPDGNGLSFIEEIQQTKSQPEVIIITGRGSLNGAETAIMQGAWDYLQKPFSRQNTLLSIKRVIEYRKAQKQSKKSIIYLESNKLVGNSTCMKKVLRDIGVAAGNDSNVLISGETGTGKEVVAKTIHENSARSDHPFVILDCAALPRHLIEDTLFGHVKGSFTGADKFTKGLISIAHNGTLFLDEVGELNLELQKKFLRVLQEKTFRRIGSSQEEKSDFRLISATNRDLDKMVSEGSFRKDLLYRLVSSKITLPPLRDRNGDIEELVYYHLNKLTDQYNMPRKGISPDVFELLNKYEWPGNVRELINIVEQALHNSHESKIIYSQNLPQDIRIKMIGKNFENPTNQSFPTELYTVGKPQSLTTYKEFRESMFSLIEKQYLQNLIEKTEGDINKALETADIGRTRFYSLLKKHQIQR